MEKDLGLSSSDYSLALSIFFVVSAEPHALPLHKRDPLKAIDHPLQGYLLNEVPSNMILARSRPSLYLPALMLVWVCRAPCPISVCARSC
jgi:hypothetical protein